MSANAEGRLPATAESLTELTYSTTRALVAETYWRSLRRNPRHRLLWLGWVALAFAGGSMGGSVREGIVASVAVAAALALTPLLLFKPQQRVLRIGPGGLWTSIGSRTGERTWGDIASVERAGEHVIITGRNLNGFIVPVSAFADHEACSDAVAQWQVWQRAAEPRAA